MYRIPGNPLALELTSSHKRRSVNLDKIKPSTVDGFRVCAWCYEAKAKGPKYCGAICRLSARAWAYPQKEEGLNFLLIRQNFKCAICEYDYKPLAEQVLVNGRVYDKPEDYKTELCWSLMRRIKQKSPEGFKPEVDHIVPISKGGACLGLDNHQAICFTCHKFKTKREASGPRKVAVL